MSIASIEKLQFMDGIINRINYIDILKCNFFQCKEKKGILEIKRFHSNRILFILLYFILYYFKSNIKYKSKFF